MDITAECPKKGKDGSFYPRTEPSVGARVFGPSPLPRTVKPYIVVSLFLHNPNRLNSVSYVISESQSKRNVFVHNYAYLYLIKNQRLYLYINIRGEPEIHKGGQVPLQPPLPPYLHHCLQHSVSVDVFEIYIYYTYGTRTTLFQYTYT